MNEALTHAAAVQRSIQTAEYRLKQQCLNYNYQTAEQAELVVEKLLEHIANIERLIDQLDKTINEKFPPAWNDFNPK